MLAHRVASLIRRRDRSPDYYGDEIKRDKKLYEATVKKADRKAARMMKLYDRQPDEAYDKYFDSLSNMTDLIWATKQEAAEPHYLRFNCYPRLTTELNGYNDTMREYIEDMEKTKMGYFAYLQMKMKTWPRGKRSYGHLFGFRFNIPKKLRFF